jgi:hypothetical protein
MPLKVCEIIDFANLFRNDFTRKSVAMSVTWYIWSFGFCSVAKNYDLQMVLRTTVYCNSMALYSYFGSMVYIYLESLWKAKKNYLYQNFKIYNVKGFATLRYRGGGSVKCWIAQLSNNVTRSLTFPSITHLS